MAGHCWATHIGEKRLAGWASAGILPKVIRETGKSFLIFQIFYRLQIRLNSNQVLNFERLSIHETKYNSTHQHNKICSGMNATYTFIYLNK
jgi:hypothetical protein